jgi:hypothetical protein
MPPAMFGLSAKPLSGRYLSFMEREEIGLLRAQGHTMRGIKVSHVCRAVCDTRLQNQSISRDLRSQPLW